ncbi:hypothetical protein ACFLZJ_00645 [Nanoarchaeota archaeon]
MPLKEKTKAIIFAGKHSGKMGNINKLDLEGKMAEIKVDDKILNVLIKQFMVIE